MVDENAKTCGCYHEGPDCGAEDGPRFNRLGQVTVPWGCTLAMGHEGPHVACGGKAAHHMHTWEDAPQSASV